MTQEEEMGALRSALDAAEARAKAAEARAQAAEARAEAAERAERLLRQRFEGIVHNIPGVAWENYFQQSPETSIVDYVSEQIEPLSGYTPDEWKQPNFWIELIHPDDRPQALADASALTAQGACSSSYRWITRDGRTLWVTSRMTLIRDASGTPIGIRGVTTDETSVKQMEAQRVEVRMREEIIRAQDEALRALSTPLVPIDKETVAMPLIGALDLGRIERVQEALLDGISRNSSKVVILDITGVPEVNEQTAEALLRSARAAALLGAEVVLTGIRPDVALTLARMQADIRTLVTRGTLQDGIAYAMSRRHAARQLGGT